MQHYLIALGGTIAVPILLFEGLCLQKVQSRLIDTILACGLCTLLLVTFGVRSGFWFLIQHNYETGNRKLVHVCNPRVNAACKAKLAWGLQSNPGIWKTIWPRFWHNFLPLIPVLGSFHLFLSMQGCQNKSVQIWRQSVLEKWEWLLNLFFKIWSDILHCNRQMHQPTTMAVRNGCHIYLPQQQHRQQWLTSSLSFFRLSAPNLVWQTRSILPGHLLVCSSQF